jgi:hypothetical protein
MSFLMHMLYVSPASKTIGSKKKLWRMKVWRYLDFTKFLSMLDNKSLYFSRIDTLNDPFEGSYTKNQIDIRVSKLTDEYCRKKRLTIDKEHLIKNYSMSNKVQRELIYVNCWHNNEYESSAMWKSFIDGDGGIAVESSVKRLWRSLKQTNDIVFVGEVKYIDYEKEKIIGKFSLFT